MDNVLFRSMEEKSMNKIIISANVLFTITNFRKELITCLKSYGYDVICVANLDDLSKSSQDILNSLDVRFIQVNINRKGINPIKDFMYLLKLVKIYKQEKPKAVLHFTIKPNIYGTFAARISGVKSINTINGLGSAIIKNNFLSKVLKHLYKFSLIFSSKVLFQNNDDKEFFLSQNLVSKYKVGIVPGSGVDTNFFTNCKSNTNTLSFLLVSRLLKDKGIYEYIDAIIELRKKYPQVKFILGGQFDFGNPSAITQEEVKNWESKDVISFIGKTDYIKDFFQLCDVIVLPSYREGLSRLLIEAASASKPIVTTNVAGCKDVVEDGVNGFLCNAKDSNSLKNAMERIILLNKEELYKMGHASQKIAQEKFDKNIVNKIYLDVIGNL